MVVVILILYIFLKLSLAFTPTLEVVCSFHMSRQSLQFEIGMLVSTKPIMELEYLSISVNSNTPVFLFLSEIKVSTCTYIKVCSDPTIYKHQNWKMVL